VVAAWRGAHRPGPRGQVLRHVLWRVLLHVLHVPASLTCRPSEAWGRHVCVGRGFRRWKMVRATLSTFTLPSSAAPNTSPATSCAASSTCSVQLFLKNGALPSSFKEVNHTLGTLSPGGCPGKTAAPPHPTERAREPFYPFLIRSPNEGGGGQKALEHARARMHTRTHVDSGGYNIRHPYVCACAPTHSLKSHPRAPPPDPRLKPGPMSVASGGGIIQEPVYRR